MNKKLERIGFNSYSISRSYDLLLYISGLDKNMFYIISFNDLSLQFFSNNDGEIYFSDDHQYLPVGCIPYNNIRLQSVKYNGYNNDKIIEPIAHYLNNPDILQCSKMILTFTLTEFLAITQEIKKVQRQFLVQNGSLGLLPPTNVTYKNFSHIGVM
jgi:hypothetical protein